MTLIGAMLLWSTAMAQDGLKPADIKTFVPTPEPKTLPDDLRKPGVFDDEYPIPQDRAKAAKNRAEWLAWWKKLTIGAYEAVGKSDPTWDAKARAALEAVAQFKAAVNLKDSRPFDAAVEATRQALIAECTDPLTRFFAFRWHGVSGEAGKGTVSEIKEFTDPLLAGKYPVALKVRVAWDTAVRFENSGRSGAVSVSQHARGYYDSFWTHYVELAKSKDRFDQDLTIELAREVEEQYVKLGQKRQDGHAAILRAYELAKVNPWVMQTTEGNFKFFGARDVNKSEAADAQKLVKERIASARKAYTAAFEANKEMPEAATMMIAVCLEEKAPREEMEAWFAKALTAEPDNAIACRAKLDFLSPGKQGNDKAILAFGRQCQRTGNQHAALGYILDDAHKLVGRGKGRAYYAEPEPWADLREVFETRLKLIPTDRYARTRFGAICLAAGEGPGAYQHLSSVKDKPWPGLLGSFDSSLKEAEELAREQSGKP